MSQILTPEQVAAELQLSMSAVYRGLESGEIPGRKIRGRWRTLREQLLEFVRDGRTPKPRKIDPMPSRRGRRRGSFRGTVIELESRRAASG